MCIYAEAHMINEGLLAHYLAVLSLRETPQVQNAENRHCITANIPPPPPNALTRAPAHAPHAPSALTFQTGNPHRTHFGIPHRGARISGPRKSAIGRQEDGHARNAVARERVPRFVFLPGGRWESGQAT